MFTASGFKALRVQGVLSFEVFDLGFVVLVLLV